MKTEVVQILIRRNLTSETCDVVFAHEIPILKVARGSENITVIKHDCTEFCLQPIEVKPRDELLRMKKKYAGFSVAGQNPVDLAYPDGSRDLELFYEDPGAFEGVGETEGGGMITDEDDIPELEPKPAPEPELTERQRIMQQLDDRKVNYARNKSTDELKTILGNLPPVEEAE